MVCAIRSIDSVKQRCSLRAAPAFMRNAMVHGLPKKAKLNLLARRVESCLKRKRGDTNKRVSNAKLRSLGWTLQYPTFADAMEKSILPGLSEFEVPLSPKR